VYDKNGKSRGYGFIEYEREKDMQNAYKMADAKKLDGVRKSSFYFVILFFFILFVVLFSVCFSFV
jgi:RNA recognition motif-containing protein